MHIYLNSLLTFGLEKKIINDFNRSLKNLEILFQTKINYERAYIDIYETISSLLDVSYQMNLFEIDTMMERDQFEALIFDQIMPTPSETKSTFKSLFEQDKNQAFSYLYELSKNTNYIKTKRLAENISFFYESDYSPLEITINLSKPEKDPKDIQKALEKPKEEKKGPKCVICKENEHNYENARMNLRLIPLELNRSLWHFQYSPYGYFNEHSIILSDEHKNMKISHKTSENLLDFIDYMPAYFIGSNADLPIVGGSILNHDHYQAGRHHFPIENAKAIKTYGLINEVEIKHLNWPLSTIRLNSKNREKLSKVVDLILDQWQNYDNIALDIVSFTTANHNTITPILRKKDDIYEFDIILRNNRTSETYPGGIFHPHADKWHIKKENIGLIEAIGLAVLPPRLKQSLELSMLYLNEGIYDDSLDAHKDWLETLKEKYNHVSIKTLYDEVGAVFEGVLEDCGVFKLDIQGNAAMDKFINEIIS
ncbi:MAG TPA: hypothetical protein VJY66_03960, partial [Acholeplasma sp.]|nr:hypothetical protein [Acholeplasma sp.]